MDTFQHDLFGNAVLPKEATFDHDQGSDTTWDLYGGLVTIFCGGRDWAGRQEVRSVMAVLNPSIVIQGLAPGADTLARVAAEGMLIPCASVPADWQGHGKRAGPLRNKAMLLLRPGLVVALPGGTGTRNMVNQAKAAGVPVLHVPPMPKPQ